MPKAFGFVIALSPACVAAGLPAAAQDAYPNKPVRVIVPFAPGGPSDVTARIIFAELSKNVGKQFFIENHARRRGQHRHHARAAAPRRTATPCC